MTVSKLYVRCLHVCFTSWVVPERRDGHGKFESKEDVYEGYWKQNLKEGFGTAKFPAGGRQGLRSSTFRLDVNIFCGIRCVTSVSVSVKNG
jgi:hypothetical protein